MKKVLSLVMAAVLLVGAVFAFSSCTARPEMDLEKAKENLEKEGYSVTYYSGEDEALDVGEAEYLRAYKAAESEDEDSKSLTVIVFESNAVAKAYYESEKAQGEAELESLKAYIKVLKAQLKAGEDDMTEEEIAKIEEEIEEMEEDIKEYKENYVLGRSGKTVWYGDKDAVDASRG